MAAKPPAPLSTPATRVRYLINSFLVAGGRFLFYTVYQITNKLNGKIYIGVHKTENIDDGYMGSGKHIKRAVQKYGKENFSKEILFAFDNPEHMFEAESVLVNEEIVKSSKSYNLKIGGFGGWDHISNFTDRNQKIAKNRDYNDPEYRKKLIEANRKTIKMRKERGDVFFQPTGFIKGSKHSEESKKKMSIAAKGRIPWNKGKN